MDDQLTCPHCAQPVFRKSNSGARYKVKTSILVLHKGGEIEFNCTACRRAIILPMRFPPKIELRKAFFTIPKS